MKPDVMALFLAGSSLLWMSSESSLNRVPTVSNARQVAPEEGVTAECHHLSNVTLGYFDSHVRN